MSCSLAKTLLLAIAIVATSADARAASITFDAGDPIGGLPVGSVLSNQYAAFGVTFSPNGFSGAGGPTGAWATNTGMQIVSSTGADVGGLGSPSLVSGNLLRSFNDWLAENGDPSLRATFSTAITSFSAAFAGIATPSSTRIFAYDGATLLTTVAATTMGQQTLSVTGGNITSVVITPGDFFDWVGVDNINFTPITASVPEPSSLLMCGIASAVGLAVARIRRKRSA